MKLNNNDDSHNSGLNLLIYNMLLDIESHPAWVCGLKLNRLDATSDWFVTPCVGVWIETTLKEAVKKGIKVTPCVGVWIETLLNSPLGLSGSVTPCVGVWIETLKTILSHTYRLSHPAWVCGLKPSWEAARAARPVTPCVGVWIETENN